MNTHPKATTPIGHLRRFGSTALTLAFALVLLAVAVPAPGRAQSRGVTIVGKVATTWGFTTKGTLGSYLTGSRVIEAVGDFDADGKADFLSQDLTGGLTMYNRRSSGAIQVIASITRGWMGSWNYSGYHQLGRVGDFDGNGSSDFVIYSAWGIGVITRGVNGQLTTLALAPFGTRIGSWTLTSGDTIEMVGRFGSTRDDLVIRDAQRSRLAILRVDAARGAFTATHFVPANATLPSFWNGATQPWRMTAGDRIVASFRTLRTARSTWDSLVIQRPNGALGVLLPGEAGATFTGLTHGSNAMFRSGCSTCTAFAAAATNRIVGSGNFSARVGTDEQYELLVKTSSGIGVLRYRASAVSPSFDVIAFEAYGYRAGSWTLSQYDTIAAIGNFEYTGRDDILVRNSSAFGTIALPWIGGHLTSVRIFPFGSALGTWTIKSADIVPTQAYQTRKPHAPFRSPSPSGYASDFDGDQRADFVLQCGDSVGWCP